MSTLLERTVVKHDQALEQLATVMNKSFNEVTAVVNRQGQLIAQLTNELNAVKKAYAELQNEQEVQVRVIPGFTRN